MTKFNTLLYPNVQNLHITSDLSLNILDNNEAFEKLKKEFLQKYSFTKLETFSSSQDGFLGLLLHLSKKGTIALSVGESHALIEAGKTYESLGFDLVWIGLEKDGKINLDEIKKADVDFMFISSYVIDTFVKTNIKEIKENTKAKIISNASADFSEFCDAIYFDSYKLTGFSLSSVLLFNEELFLEQAIGFTDTVAVASVFQALNNQSFETSQKELFKDKLKEAFNEDIYFFVDSNDTLDFTLHFALRNIKAREMIRTLALNSILITNGEGCSLGLSKPSRVIQEMGYEEIISRNALSLTFTQILEVDEIEKIAKIFAKKYRQIRILNEL